MEYCELEDKTCQIKLIFFSLYTVRPVKQKFLHE